MKTTIHSASTSTTADELIATTLEKGATVDHWFPEIQLDSPSSVPRCEEDILKLLPELIGATIITMSDIVILWFLQEVREERMNPADLILYCNGSYVEVDSEGEIDWWKDGFFRTRGKLLF
jgi:hypothetical protein